MSLPKPLEPPKNSMNMNPDSDVTGARFHVFGRVSKFNEDMERSYLIVHRVTCRRFQIEGEDHYDHSELLDYFDTPRLFAGDTRGSALRGEEHLKDFLEYWDYHSQFQFAVIKEYSCTVYHSKIKRSFELIAPGIERQVPNRLRPWLYRLTSPGPPAMKDKESITISDTLSSAMTDLVLKNQSLFGQWDSKINLQEPYDYFYHFRKSLRQQGCSQLSAVAGRELIELLNYIDESQGMNFDEVDNVFGSGKVRREMFTKLFAPNDIIVTLQDGHSRAFIAEKVLVWEKLRQNDLQIIALEGWTWTFDGSFRKTTEALTVSWPSSNPEVVPIESLSAWPLRLDRSNRRQSLEKRGRDFWSCRHRKLVSYDAPTPTIFELQIVSINS